MCENRDRKLRLRGGDFLARGLVLHRDAGYGVPSTFGGMVPTPGLDHIAQNGLR
jgi:hypothetical protein